MKVLFSLTYVILFYGHIRLTRGDCSTGEFQCSSTQCIRATFVCDGDSDCPDASDERNCHTELLQSNFLIVADSGRRNLFQVGLDDGIMVPILPIKPLGPIAVAYDSLTGFVYWTDVSQRTIGRYSLTAAGSRTISIVKQFEATAVLDGLAIDAARQDLYYCNAGDVGKIGVMKTNGGQHRELIRDVEMKPRSIVLDLNSRLMYWSDWGNRSSISRANMDTGADRVVLVSGDLLVWPNALAIDFATRTMFWGDAKTGLIRSANLDGTERKALYINPLDHYYGFAVTPRFLYITDWTERAVRKLDRRTYTMSNQPPAIFGRLAGIIYVAHVRFNETGSIRISTSISTTKSSITTTTSSFHTTTSTSATTTTSRIRSVTTTTPITTSFPTTTTSSTPIKFSTNVATASPMPMIDQQSTNVSVGVLSETTLIIIVCIGVVGIVLISLFCSLAICAAKKRSRSSSVNAGTVNPGQQFAVSYTASPALLNNHTKQTTTYDNCRTSDTYDYIHDSNLYYMEPRSSTSSDGYMKPVYATGQRRQQPPPQPGGHYDKIQNM